MTRFERAFVWLGGAAFVASLGYTAWWYAVDLARPRPFAGWQAVALDTLLVGVFAVHHSVCARPSVKTALARACPERLLRSVYVWIASLLLLGVCLLWRPIGGEIYRHEGWTAVAHAAVQLAGLSFIVRSVRAIDPLELAGIRVGAGGVEDLQIAGPYRIVRHPLYLGWMLIVFGAAHMTADRLAFAAMTSAYLILAIPWEERSLERTFGADYERYRQSVRWKVLPFVY